MSQSIHLTQPKRDVQTVETRSGLPTHRQRPQARFVYVVYPKSWEFDLELGFLPIMRRLVAKPGANGVDGRGNLSRPIASAQTKGGTYIDPKDTRLGPYMDYVQFYDTDTGGRWYVDFCAKATVLTTGEIIWNVRESEPEFAQFRKHLRAAGIVPPLMPEVFQWLMAREQEKASNLLNKSISKPHLEKRHTEQIKKLEAMQAAWDEMQGKKATAKGTTPKRKKSANIIEG